MSSAVTTVEDVAPITEYGATISVVFTSDAWTAYALGSGRLVAQFRVHPRSDAVLWAADSDLGTITRPGSYTLTITIPDSAGELLVGVNYVYFDFVHIASDVYTPIPTLVKWPTGHVVTKKVNI